MEQSQEFVWLEDSETQVAIGQSCSIGNRLKYSALSLDGKHFVDLYPRDVGVFLGHKKFNRKTPSLVEGHKFVQIEEAAIFPRVGIVFLAEGVLEPANK